MKILHLVRNIADERALRTAEAQAREHQVSVLLLQDAVLTSLAFPGTTYACREDVDARGARSAAEPVEYERMVELIFAHDRVVSW